jgi:hypothetical protein
MIFNGTMLGMGINLKIKLDPNKLQSVKQTLGLTRENDKVTVYIRKTEQKSIDEFNKPEDEEITDETDEGDEDE